MTYARRKRTIYSQNIIIILGGFLFPFFFSCQSIPRDINEITDNTDTTTKKEQLYVEGTFIQEWLVVDWGDLQWQSEFSALKKVGIKYVILTTALHGDVNNNYTTIYPTSLTFAKQTTTVDVIERCLFNAQMLGIKVFIGINFNDNWWKASTLSNSWLCDQMEKGNQVAKEIYTNYKSRYNDTLYGWYWVWEIDNLNWQSLVSQNLLIKAMNISLDYLNNLSPDMPVMLSPFVNSVYGTPEQNGGFWKYIFSKTNFKKGDIFAPQDCIGAGGIKIEDLARWFKSLRESVNSKPGLQFWSNAENFEQNFWVAAPLQRFVKQTQLVNPYVDKIISFSYTHYYSPNQKTAKFHKTYIDYFKNGILKENVPQNISNLRVVKHDDQFMLVWNEPSAKENVAGYYVYENNILIGNFQYNAHEVCTTQLLINPVQDVKKTYSVCSYNSVGTTSSPTYLSY